ncbi:unnamed protein product [Gadus morhua 'NCC']
MMCLAALHLGTQTLWKREPFNGPALGSGEHQQGQPGGTIHLAPCRREGPQGACLRPIGMTRGQNPGAFDHEPGSPSPSRSRQSWTELN